MAFIDNSDEVIRELERRMAAALDACGQTAVTHAKDIITAGVPRNADGTSTGALKNSIEHQSDAQECVIGTNLSYAIYNEYGTGIYADGGGRQTPWAYQDAKGQWHRTNGMTPLHFLKNAVANHVSEYRRIIKQYIED